MLNTHSSSGFQKRKAGCVTGRAPLDGEASEGHHLRIGAKKEIETQDEEKVKWRLGRRGAITSEEIC